MTTEEHLAQLSEQARKILQNQKRLEGLLHIIGNHLYAPHNSVSSPEDFQLMAKGWQVET